MAKYAYGRRPTVEAYKAIDVREIGPGKSLRPGLSGTWRWSRNGEPTGSVDFRIEGDAVELTYRLRSHGAVEWRDIEQRIPLTWTACALGGRRPWFRCRCGRRVAVLYDYGELFECRQCCGLAYESQSENPTFRSLRRAQVIRERLGGDPSVFSFYPAKPRGMHWRTYERLRAQGLAADRQTIDLVRKYLRRPVHVSRPRRGDKPDKSPHRGRDDCDRPAGREMASPRRRASPLDRSRT
jgi:hypothetical protein